MIKEKIGVVIRTKNEGRWIAYCLKALAEQEGVVLPTVVLVDCKSEDSTVERARQVWPSIKVLTYEGEYFPGKSINQGMDALAGCEYLVVLSAHCVPVGKNWLHEMVKPLLNDPKIAGSYCRQLPTTASNYENYRDLVNCFSEESRVQRKDSFFHNAASVIRKEVWRSNKFDESLKHIEDRYWAREVLSNGWLIHYNSDASVVHEHGLNQHDDEYRSFRGKGVASLLDSSALIDYWHDFAERVSDTLVIGLCSDLKNVHDDSYHELNTDGNQIVLIPKRGTEELVGHYRSMKRKVDWDDLSLYDLLSRIVKDFAAQGDLFDYVYFVDLDKNCLSESKIKDYLSASLSYGADMCVKVTSYKEDFFMLDSGEQSWVPLSSKLMDTYENKPHFKKARYGDGTLIRSVNLISGIIPKDVFFDE